MINKNGDDFGPAWEKELARLEADKEAMKTEMAEGGIFFGRQERLNEDGEWVFDLPFSHENICCSS